MKCGICGQGTMLVGPKGSPYTGYIYTVEDLNMHKLREHPAEWLAVRESRRLKKEAAKAQDERRRQARRAAGRLVLKRSAGEGPTSISSSDQLQSWEVGRDPPFLSNVRFPDAAEYEKYGLIEYQIRILKTQAQAILTAAWETGTPVTTADLDELDKAEREATP